MSSLRTMRGARRRGTAAAVLRTAALGCGLAAVLGVGAPARADGFLEFGDLTEPQLFELFTAVGDELIVRGVLTDLEAPIDAYARWLVVRALALEPAADGPHALGPGGARYRVFGLRGAAARALDVADADVVVIVALTIDDQIERAVLIPSEAMPALLDAEGRLAPSDELWRRPGLTDVTPQVFRAASAQ